MHGPILLLLEGLQQMVGFLVTRQLLHPILVQVHVFLGEVRDLVRLQEHVVALEAAQAGWVHSGEVLPLRVDDPIYVEVLNRTHDHLGPLKGQELLAVWVAADYLPNIGELYLLALASVRPDEAQIQEQLRHLCAAYLDVEVVGVQVAVSVVDELYFLADLDKVRVESIVHDLIGLGTDLGSILVHTRLHRKHVVDLLLGLLSSRGILHQVHSPVELLRDRIDLRPESLLGSLLLQVTLLLLHLLHFTELHRILLRPF